MNKNQPISPGNINPETDNEISNDENTKTAIGALQACPHCHTGTLAYDGCLNLFCSVCDYTQTGGGFT